MQFADEFAGGFQPLGRVFAQASHANVLQQRRHRRLGELRRRGDVRAQRLREDLVEGGAGHRRPSGEHLVEHRAKAVDVRAVIQFRVLANLLRRHVGHRALQFAGAGGRGLGVHRAAPRVGLRQHLGEAPIEHQHLAERADQHVFGLDVPMRDAVVVGVGQCVGHLDDHFDEAGEVVALAEVENLAQRVAMHQLHREVAVPLRVAAELVGGYGVRVLQHRAHPRLAHEAALLRGVVRELGLQALVANRAHEVQILAGLNDRATAAGDGLEVRVAGARIHPLGQRPIGVRGRDYGVFVPRLGEAGHALSAAAAAAASAGPLGFLPRRRSS